LIEDRSHVGPLLGNDEVKLVLDARGCMHDFAARPAWPPPRIVWTGRRHNQRIDQYNSNLFEYGFFDIRLTHEDKLPPVTSWRQRLHPSEGWVETVIEREGGMRETAITFLHLKRNIIVCRRKYENLPAAIAREVQAKYVFCQADAAEIPFRTTWSPLAPSPTGVAADFTADGHRVYQGRIALFAARECRAETVDNQLLLTIPLSDCDTATTYIALEDDLGDDRQLVVMMDGEWMPKGVREVHRENAEQERQHKRTDYARAIEQSIEQCRREGFDAVLKSQCDAWREYTDQFCVTFPEEAGKLASAFYGAVYHVRCGASNFNWGSSPFNNSWGAHYAWNERYPTEGLLAWGVYDIPLRVLEYRRRILPFLCQRAAARGADYHHSSVEPGTQTSERNGTNFYEQFLGGLIAHYMSLYWRYMNDTDLMRRYYPVIREVAEFYRHWVLIELPGNNLMTAPLIDVNESVYPVQDGPFTICSAARALDLAVRAAKELGEDADLLTTWERYRDLSISLVRHVLRDSLPNNGLYRELELDAVADPNLEIDTTIRDWRDAYRAANAGLDQFKKHGQNVSGDHSKPRNWPWGAFQQAWANSVNGNPGKAMASYERGLRVLLPFNGQCESAEEDFSRIDHPWFTTASGALLRAVAKTLMHTRDNEIWLLPGVPESWRDLSFTLPALGAVDVSVKVERGKLQQLSLTPKQHRPERRFILHVPARMVPEDAALPQGVEFISTDGANYVVRVGDTLALEIENEPLQRQRRLQ